MAEQEMIGGTAPEPSPLAAVVDDYAPRQDAVEWAVGALAGGRGFDEVDADLTGQGWDAEAAAWIVEEARQATRAHRGVVTRNDVMRESNRRYRAGMKVGWFTGFPVIASFWRLIHSLGNMLVLRRRGGRR